MEAILSGFNVIVDGKSMNSKVESTGGFGEFKTVTLGQTNYLQAGEHSIQIKPKKGKWQPINLRSITLEPFATVPK